MRSNQLLLEDIQTRTERILANLERFTREELESDPNAYEATLRHLEIIGEAVKNLDEAFKLSHPEISWRQIGRTRDILAHVYFGVSEDRIWDIVSNHVPTLHQFVTEELLRADQSEQG